MGIARSFCHFEGLHRNIHSDKTLHVSQFQQVWNCRPGAASKVHGSSWVFSECAHALRQPCYSATGKEILVFSGDRYPISQSVIVLSGELVELRWRGFMRSHRRCPNMCMKKLDKIV